MKTITKKPAVKTAPHLIVQALAGCGKTTTAVEGCNRLRGNTNLKGSVQQEAIFAAMMEGQKPLTIAIVAYNKNIADELKTRVPSGVDAMTMHSLGLKSVSKQFGRCKIEGYRTRNLIEKHLGETAFAKLRKESFTTISLVEDVVSLCKQTLVDFHDADAMEEMIVHYDIALNGDRSQVMGLAEAVLEMSKDPSKDLQIDFDDMIWLPVIHKLTPTVKYDLLIVDEAQDLNRARQELALQFGKRLMLIGDVHQAIYGFTGADAESMNRMEKTLSESASGCKVLPLTETRRCGKAIVAHAAKLVPDFSAHESCPAGEVISITDEQFQTAAQAGDMILCRTNAPLVSQAFRWLKQRVPCYIRGRDIGRKLTQVVDKAKADSVADLMTYVEQWRQNHIDKELAKKNPNQSAIQSTDDVADCIILFATDCDTVHAVKDSIKSMFDDNARQNSRMLSSVHKAKGLEAPTVWILKPELMPGPWAKQAWEQQQEQNVMYVSRTRAIHKLGYVETKKSGK